MGVMAGNINNESRKWPGFYIENPRRISPCGCCKDKSNTGLMYMRRSPWGTIVRFMGQVIVEKKGKQMLVDRGGMVLGCSTGFGKEARRKLLAVPAGLLRDWSWRSTKFC